MLRSVWATETAIKKLAAVASLQRATETAIKKLPVVASLQRTTGTPIKEFVVVASLQWATEMTLQQLMVASLQWATETAINKLAMVAYLQRATETPIKKIAVVASLHHAPLRVPLPLCGPPQVAKEPFRGPLDLSASLYQFFRGFGRLCFTLLIKFAWLMFGLGLRCFHFIWARWREGRRQLDTPPPFRGSEACETRFTFLQIFKYQILLLIEDAYGVPPPPPYYIWD